MSIQAQGASAPIEFNFTTTKIRVVVDEQGNPLFCAKDVCDLLEYTNSRKAIDDHCEPSGVTIRYITCDIANRDTTSRARETQSMIFISEGNLYRLIIKSNKPQSKAFEAWVCDEVLPSIRRQGSYGKPVAIDDQLKLEAAMLRYLKELQACRCSFTLKLITDRLQTICQQLNQPMPKLNLIGQDPKQSRLPGFDVE